MDKQNTIKTLKLFYKSSPFLFIAIEFLTLLQGILPFCSLVIFKTVIDRAGSLSGFNSAVIILILLWTGIFLFQYFAAVLNSSFREMLSRKTLLVLNTKIMNKTLSFNGIKNFEDKNYREMERRLDFCSNI